MHNDSSHGTENGPGYETSDVKISVIVWSFIGTFLMLGVSVVLMLVMLRAWEDGAMSDTILTVKPSQATTTAAEIVSAPEWDTEVRLQDSPNADQDEYKAVQFDRLNNYRWLDEDKGIATIPVEVAMKKALANGLPSWPQFSPEALAAAEAGAAAPAEEATAPAQETPAQP